MPLPSPILDDRTFEQLRQELIRRIPVYTQEWTDHNESDPGIALLELTAFLGEQLLFRFNQIPDATQLAFLNLLDIPLQPAKAARGLVQLGTKKSGGELLELRSELKAGDTSFETRREARVFPLEAIVVLKEWAATPEGAVAEDFLMTALDTLGDNEVAAYYKSKVLGEDPTAPDFEPLDSSRAVDGSIWIAVLKTKNTDREALNGKILNVGFVPVSELAGDEDPSDLIPCAASPSAPSDPAVLWQASTGVLQGLPVYRELKVTDSTGGLTREGVVRLQLPEKVADLQPALLAPQLAGTGHFPPPLGDPKLEERVLFWLRASRRPRPGEPSGTELGSFGRVRWMGLNATEVMQARKARRELLGTGDGQPNRVYTLINRPVLPGSAVLEVEETPGRWVKWTEVDGFEVSKPESRHFTLDREAGEVTFGDHHRGLPPQPGQRIRVVEYLYGGGRKGNVPPKAISKAVLHGAMDVSNPLRLRGGSDGESVAAALERVPGEVRRRYRAVTADDFRELALQTPGVAVGRAETLPLFDPTTRQGGAAGAVTLVVWPEEDVTHPNAPLPDRTMLRNVCQWMDQHRLITTELWVVPPTYRKIAVSVGLEVRAGHGVEAVRRWADLAVRQYLAPLPPFGPDGRGWPLGRRVHGPELAAAVLQVEGVQFLVDDVRLAVLDESADPPRWRQVDATVDLDPWEVPELLEITIEEGPPLEPGIVAAPQPATPLLAPPAPTPEPPTPGEAPVPRAPEGAPSPVPVAIPVPPEPEC